MKCLRLRLFSEVTSLLLIVPLQWGRKTYTRLCILCRILPISCNDHRQIALLYQRASSRETDIGRIKKLKQAFVTERSGQQRSQLSPKSRNLKHRRRIDTAAQH